VDECRAHMALLRTMIREAQPEPASEMERLLGWVLVAMFPIGTECSDPGRHHPEYRRTELQAAHLHRLEEAQAAFEARVNWERTFIAGASNSVAAQADIAAVVTRRMERAIVRLKEQYPDLETKVMLPFVNRLSDTLFVMARVLEGDTHEAVDYGVLE